MFDIPFGTTDWEGVERTEHAGETGKAYWRTRNFNNIRVLIVDGRTVVLKPGQSYQVADGDLAHRSRTESGAKLFIVD